ncbi:Uncharacterized protein TCM_042700 [Theobroma cacao]|uniref:Uncharacterized protein n=1 Tax=Theobroma cacao TaxID=3641 RepID=A0A061FM84_THECC|nr:Uncharacterized protein TCM_042700 [Theobroma cacao]
MTRTNREMVLNSLIMPKYFAFPRYERAWLILNIRCVLLQTDAVAAIYKLPLFG